jgi:hypothetical protein
MTSINTLFSKSISIEEAIRQIGRTTSGQLPVGISPQSTQRIQAPSGRIAFVPPNVQLSNRGTTPLLRVPPVKGAVTPAGTPDRGTVTQFNPISDQQRAALRKNVQANIADIRAADKPPMSATERGMMAQKASERRARRGQGQQQAAPSQTTPPPTPPGTPSPTPTPGSTPPPKPPFVSQATATQHGDLLRGVVGGLVNKNPQTTWNAIMSHPDVQSGIYKGVGQLMTGFQKGGLIGAVKAGIGGLRKVVFGQGSQQGSGEPPVQTTGGTSNTQSEPPVYTTGGTRTQPEPPVINNKPASSRQDFWKAVLPEIKPSSQSNLNADDEEAVNTQRLNTDQGTRQNIKVDPRTGKFAPSGPVYLPLLKGGQTVRGQPILSGRLNPAIPRIDQ